MTGTSALVDEPLSCDHYFRLSRSVSPNVLTRIPSSFNSSPLYAISSPPPHSVSVFTKGCVSANACTGNDLSYSLFCLSMQVSRRARTHYRIFASSPQCVHSFSLMRDKKTGRTITRKFRGRSSAPFDSHATRKCFVRRKGDKDVTQLRPFTEK